MTTKRDSDGNPLNRPRVARTIPGPPLSVVSAPDPLSLWKEESERNVGVLLARLCSIEGGYLKARRPSDEEVLHLTWTWTIGKHAQKYVYVRVEWWKLEVGLHLLLQKLLEVEEGNRRPSPDKYLT